MNTALETFAEKVHLTDPSNQQLRFAFTYACAARVRHLLEDQAVVDCLGVLEQFVNRTASLGALELAQHAAARLANSHAGSKSIDGCGHAAVSATYAVAKALAGKALEAAGYAAYATVYAQGGYAAVADRGSFEPEFAWQVASLNALAAQLASGPDQPPPIASATR